MKDKIIGYTTGVFDMFHIGHLNLLRQARQQCDFLIVGVSTDELVEKEKHKVPIISLEERVEIVKELKCVDMVVIQENKNKMEAWEKYHFHRMFVGSDWKGTVQWNTFEQQFKSVGVEIIYLQYTNGISSTVLAEKVKQHLL